MKAIGISKIVRDPSVLKVVSINIESGKNKTTPTMKLENKINILTKLCTEFV
jgi:hypothetical protein